jgi:hypothetical protein
LRDVFSQRASTHQHAPGQTHEFAGRLALFQTFQDVNVAVIPPLAQIREGRIKTGEFLQAGHLRPQFLKMLSFFRCNHGRWPSGSPVTSQARLTSIAISHLTFRPPWRAAGHNDTSFGRSAKAFSGLKPLKSRWFGQQSDPPPMIAKYCAPRQIGI